MIRSLDELLKRAQESGPATVAVAAAQDEAALSAMSQACAMGLAEGILFGDRKEIEAIIKRSGEALPEAMSIVDEADAAVALYNAVESVRNGDAAIVLKGAVKTSALLKAVLDKERGLRTGRLLSDVFLFESSLAHGNSLIAITDGGVTLDPDLAQKVEIIKNAVEVAHALGNECPRVALLSAVETVVPALLSTVDAAIITKMNQRGQIKGCLIDGPLALDNAVSEEAAEIKGITSEVAGKADILVCPGIEAANMLAKSITYFAGCRLAHVVMGSSAPVLIPSRADTAEAKLFSIALGVLVSKRDN